MKIELEKGSNGIHEYYTIKVLGVTLEDLDYLKEIIKVNDKFNEEQIKNA